MVSSDRRERPSNHEGPDLQAARGIALRPE